MLKHKNIYQMRKLKLQKTDVFAKTNFIFNLKRRKIILGHLFPSAIKMILLSTVLSNHINQAYNTTNQLICQLFLDFLKLLQPSSQIEDFISNRPPCEHPTCTSLIFFHDFNGLMQPYLFSFFRS